MSKLQLMTVLLTLFALALAWRLHTNQTSPTPPTSGSALTRSAQSVPKLTIGELDQGTAKFVFFVLITPGKIVSKQNGTDKF